MPDVSLSPVIPIPSPSPFPNDDGGSQSPVADPDPISAVDPAPPAPEFHPDEVTVEGDVQAVPQETVGWDEAASEPAQPLPPVSQTAPEFLQVSEPEPAPDTESDTELTQPVVTSEDPQEENAEKIPSDSEKSPLDILEDILAGAEAEKNKKEDEEAKKKAEEERILAEHAAKEEAFRQDAEVRIQDSLAGIEDVKEERLEAEAELVHQGKITPDTDTSGNDQFAIHQLQHKTSDDV